MQTIKQSDPRAAFRRVYFTAVSAAALTTRLQASDMSTFTVYLAKNGGTPAAYAGTTVEVGAANAKGLFYVQLTAAGCDTPGRLAIVITNAAGGTVMEKREIDVEIEQAYLFTVSSSTTTAIACDHAQATANFFKNALVEPLSGSGLGQVAKCSTSASGLLGLDTDRCFALPLANGDIIELHTR